MKIKAPTTISGVCLTVAAVGISAPIHADAFYEALTGGKAKLDVRTRYEQVDQDGIDEKAGLLSIRTRLGYETGSLLATKAYVEMEDVRDVFGVDDFELPGGPGEYPVIADPASTELNQAYLSITPVEGLEIKPGRQRLILDNARFVGNVGWRQNEQTFDALTVNYKVAGFGVTASYLTQINGITPAFDAKAEDVILNVGYSFGGIGKLTGYYYDIDHLSDAAKTEILIETTGVRFAGSTGDDIKFHYAAEFATQDNSINDKSADYLFGEFGVGFKPVTTFVGYELLSSDEGTYAFQTPLATKHAFNGWADKFLATPDDGLEDVYVKAVAKVVGMKFVAVYHQYTGDESGDDLGTEVNFVAVKPFAKKYKVGLKYASYSADTHSVDADKFWLWGEMKF